MSRTLLCPSIGVLFATASLLLASPHPLGLNENHPYGRLTSDYESPHVAWAKPYAGGPIRALVLAPTWSQRETVELAERLALDYTPWMTADFFRACEPAAADQAFRFFQPPPSTVNQALEDALRKDYDVIVVGKLDWSLIPARRRLELLERVAGGAGLVYINPPQTNQEIAIAMQGGTVAGAADFILGGIPLGSLPALRALPPDRLLKTAAFGKGRVVLLDYAEQVPAIIWEAVSWPCLTPTWDDASYRRMTNAPVPLAALPEAQFVPYEYYQALVAKAVVWAARKESPVRLGLDVPASIPWPAAGKRIGIRVEAAPKRTVVKAVARDRYEWGRIYPVGADGSLPELSCGEYILDAWALAPDGKTVHTWNSVAFAVTNDFTFGELTLSKSSFDGGDPLAGTLALPRALAADERLVLDLSDNYGRLLVSQPLTVATTNAVFSLTLPAPLTTLHRLDAHLLRGDREVIRKRLDFPVRCRRGWDDFNEVSWGGGGANNAIPFLSLKKLAEQDEVDAFDVGWAGPVVARNVALANAWCLPYQARYGCLGASTNHMVGVANGASGCMSHPTTHEQLRKWGEEQSAVFGPYGPLAWTHGDETFYSADPDVCWCEYCLPVFQRYLRNVYPDLTALNAEWKSAYTNWADVRPLSLEEARAGHNYAPWVEHCLANGGILADFYRKSSEALAVHDPDNRAGFDGTASMPMPNGGVDWWRISRTLNLMQDYVYNNESTELIRSFARPGQLRGRWYGTYGLTWVIGPNTVAYDHQFPWETLFHGCNSTWFWMMGSPGPVSGYAPDLTGLPFFQARTEALKTIKTGLGKLLLDARRLDDGIAVHYSEASRIADTLFASPSVPRSEAYVRALADVNRALEDAGLQYRYVSYDQVAEGELAKRGYKVLIMPHSRSVSDAECAAIREFVLGGGVVLADTLPAILNGHGTPQPQSRLADLFPGGATNVVNAIGKGKTVLIGDMLKGYGYTAYENQGGWKNLGAGASQLARLLATTANVRPAVTITHRGAGHMPPTEVTRFESGGAQVVGLLRSYWMYDTNAYPVRLDFPTKSHVYDAIGGEYLGETQSLDTDLSYRVRLYALLPYRVAAVKVSGPRKCRAGVPATFCVRVKAKGTASLATHGFRVEVAGPDGKALPHYAVNAVGTNGVADVAIPWALNDLPGDYTIRARDVLSGVSSGFRVQVSGKEGVE